uniref:Uncharacterized protein n=1 Tax=Alexandrium monilatum TaxID=311494 RepID=A0A7S4QDU0_9DINO
MAWFWLGLSRPPFACPKPGAMAQWGLLLWFIAGLFGGGPLAASASSPAGSAESLDEEHAESCLLQPTAGRVQRLGPEAVSSRRDPFYDKDYPYDANNPLEGIWEAINTTTTTATTTAANTTEVTTTTTLPPTTTTTVTTTTTTTTQNDFVTDS